MTTMTGDFGDFDDFDDFEDFDNFMTKLPYIYKLGIFKYIVADLAVEPSYRQ